MTLEVLAPGLLTTVQDLGRPGAALYGVPPAGAMDPFALMAANALVGNDWGEAALELTVAGPTLRADADCVVAVTGADLEPHVDGRPVPTWWSILLRRGAVLEFRGRRWGARAYLGVAGGIAVPVFLGSKSTYLPGGFGGLDGRPLRAGDRVPVGPPSGDLSLLAGRFLPPERRPPYGADPVLRVVLGPHRDRFTAAGLAALLDGAYTVKPSSDRMGYRLEGPPVEHVCGADVVSHGLPLGAVQVPGDRQPIVLMADHQTTGGYAVVGVVATVDIPLLAQCLPGDTVRFRAVDVAEAQQALRERIAGLRLSDDPSVESLRWAR